MEFDIISHRKKASLRRKKRLIALLLVLLTALMLITVISTGVFDIKEVEVVGNTTLKRLEIEEQSQIVIGKNIFKFKKTQTIENLKEHPFVEDVSIKVILPGKIRIEISEREIAGAVEYLGSYIYIDEKGYILKIDQSINEIEYPLIANVDISPPRVGEKVKFLSKPLQNMIINVMQLLNKEQMLQQIRAISADEDNNLIMTCDRSNQIKLASSKELDYKIMFLKEILLYLQEKEVGPGYINMLHEGNPVYSPTKNWED